MAAHNATMSGYTEAEYQVLADELSGHFRTREGAMRLARAMLGAPDPFEPDGRPMTASRVRRYAFNFSLLVDGDIGWLSRDGEFWGCAYRAHERLCRFLGVEEKDLERDGWARLNAAHEVYQCAYRLSAKQRRVESKGFEIDDAEERMKPMYSRSEDSLRP